MAWMLVGGFGVLGICVALLLPPFHLPDERRHWITAHLRAEQLAGGDEICSQDVALERHFRLRIHFAPERKVPPGTWEGVTSLEPACEDTIQYGFGNVFSYPAVLLGRWLTPEPRTGSQALLRFRAMRILAGGLLLALLARAAFLARSDPEGPPPLLLMLLALPLSPLFVQQSFGITPDGVVNAAALSLATWLAFGRRVARIDLAVLCLLTLIAALTKPVLVPVLPAALLLGLWLEERDAADGAPGLLAGLRRGLARRRVLTLALAGAALAGVGFAAANPGTIYKSGAIDGAAQLAYIRGHPLHALGVMTAGLARVLLHPTSLIGPLGYLDTEMRWPTQLAFGAVLGLALAAETLGRSVRRRRRAAAAAWLALALYGSLAVSLMATAFNMYLMATNVGGDTLYGLQPRYVLPQLLVALGAASGLLRGRLPATALGRLPGRALAGLLLLAILALAVSTSLDLIHRYG